MTAISKKPQKSIPNTQPIYTQPNIIKPLSVLPILPKGKTISDSELIHILTTKNSLYVSNQDGHILLNILPPTAENSPLVPEVKIENEELNSKECNLTYDEITIDETVIKEEPDENLLEFHEEQIYTQSSLNTKQYLQSKEPLNNIPKRFLIKPELLHLVNIIKKIKISNLDKIHMNFMMLPSMPNLCTPSKSAEIDVSYTPNPSNNTIDPSNYQINVVSNNGKSFNKVSFYLFL